jgi:hypothetical protein
MDRKSIAVLRIERCLGHCRLLFSPRRLLPEVAARTLDAADVQIFPGLAQPGMACGE